MLTILFDGISYGMLLFVLAMGLAVTLGLMNIINLAHGVFAMAGGYLTVMIMERLTGSFLWCLPLSFLALAAVGALLEWTLYRRIYGKSPLDQVLFSIGLTFMAVSAFSFFLGTSQRNITLTGWLAGRTEIGSGLLQLGMGHFRIFIIAVCALLTLGLQLAISYTRFGSRLRASVDDPRVAAGLGINVNRVFLVTFAIGSGLAGLGGALSVGIVSIDPNFPLTYMMYFLIVVAVGGSASIGGPLAAALILGIADVAGKYFIPKMGPFTVYLVMIVLLMWRPQGVLQRAGARS